MSRTPIHLTVSVTVLKGEDNSPDTVVRTYAAIASDGTMWRCDGGDDKWCQLPLLPAAAETEEDRLKVVTLIYWCDQCGMRSTGVMEFDNYAQVPPETCSGCARLMKVEVQP